MCLPTLYCACLHVGGARPCRFYLYMNFALEWDKSLVPADERPTADADAAEDAPNGQHITTPATANDQPTVYLEPYKVQ